jgi:hypothetical protein
MAELTDERVRYLTDVDHHDHEAMIALDGETGEGIEVARFVRNRERPDVAELAVTWSTSGRARGWVRCWSRSPALGGGNHHVQRAVDRPQRGDDAV